MPLERDEGEYAYAGQLILQGIPPYQLAWNMKFPGVYFAYAALMSVFGQSPQGVQLRLILVTSASLVLVFLIGHELMNLAGGLMASVFFTLLAAEFLRRSPAGGQFELQKQAHDSVLREKDRLRGAFEKSCFYVLDNPRRKGLVNHPRDWHSLRAVVPGHPFLHPLADDFWELFWKIYCEKREPAPVAAHR